MTPRNSSGMPFVLVAVPPDPADAYLVVWLAIEAETPLGFTSAVLYREIALSRS